MRSPLSDRLTELFEERPLLSCVAITLLAEAAQMLVLPVVGVPLAVLRVAPPGRLEDAARVTAAILMAVLVTGTVWRILARRGWTSLVGFNGPRRWRQARLAWVPALYVLANLVNLVGKPLHAPADWSLWVQAGLFSGTTPFIEESLFRGLVLAVLLNRFHQTRGQVVGAVLFSSLLFGLWHLPALLSPYVPWPTALANVIYATLAGVGFCAVSLRTRSIWLLFAAHAGIVFTGRLPGILTIGKVVPPTASITTLQGAWLSAIGTTLIFVPLFLYGLWLLRDVRKLELSFPAAGATAGPKAARSDAPPRHPAMDVAGAR